ncbi:listerin E3 ubiquitin protein ligase 1 [Dermatophagoides pteronyssinus]|uniref:E3 ubiquitin-protein ligase listerin n=1 Tax=Dermatophagoides pteronyssinus TaxID=6956 RepID=A0ABQ8IY89_DERPT|nr:listerin E3 ubiquitin protein ligase 1 [Dermatophagoides pteronyssinus]
MSNRTKGNVKPSNSERASRLLTTNKFLSFSEASKNLSSVYKATDGAGGGGDNSRQNDSITASAFDCEISSDFQQIFKHMAKKDVNTKIKALEEFVELCRQKNQNELLSIARFWFRLYRKLANSLEWNIRNASHETQYRFISSIDKNLIQEYFEPLPSVNESSIVDNRTGEISFQTLITMPAVMWNSCFDAYSQPFQSARNVFRHLFPRDKTINFLLDNCDSILNYCLYFLFNKIPIELFYNTSLPADSIRMFEDHQIGTCLLSLSTMINELLCFYRKNNNKNIDNVYECLEKIFIRLNDEFIRCKGLMVNDDIDNNDDHSQTSTTKKTLENQFEELEMSRKEKKKLNKKKNLTNKQEKIERKICSIWNSTTSNNDYIRIASFQALNAFTRLTSFFFGNDNNFNEENFKNISKQRLWFKLYKGNYFTTIMNGMIDSTIEIRGISWLLASHLLSNHNDNNIFNQLWSIVNRNDWLEKTLKPFIANGMKSPGSIIDFGIDRIGLKSYSTLYPELSYQMDAYFSGLGLICPQYYERCFMTNFNDKINLIMIFIRSFNQNQTTIENCHSIFDLFLTNLLDSFKNIGLLTDLLFLIELFFNIIYLALQELSSFRPSDERQMMITSCIDHLHCLLKQTINQEKRDLYLRSQIYSNHLLLINHLLTTNFHHDHNIAILRFMTESFYYYNDGYFSYDYYCNESELNFERNIWKLLKQQQQQQRNDQKQVKFEQNVNDNDQIESLMMNRKKLFENCLLLMTNTTTNHNHHHQLSNETIISLPDMIPTLFPHYNRILNELINQLNLMFETNIQSESTTMKKFEDKIHQTYFMLSHLQYIITFVNKFTACFIDDDDDTKWIKYRYMIIVGSKILDIYLVDMAKSEQSAEHLKMFLSNLDPFTFSKFWIIILPKYQFKLSLIQQQIMTVFTTSTNKNQIDFETIILNELLNHIVINVEQYDDDDDETFKLIAILIEKICNHYNEIDNIVQHCFYLQFPKLLFNLYRKLLKNSSKLFLIENFSENFHKHSVMLLEKIVQSISTNPDVDDDNERIFDYIENVEEFFISTQSLMYENYDYFDRILDQQTALQLEFILENFIDFKIIDCNGLIINRIGRFVKIILNSLLNNDDNHHDYQESDKIIMKFLENLNEKFTKNICLKFKQTNDFSKLYNLYGISGNFIETLLQFIDQNVNDNDDNLDVYMKQISKWNIDQQYNDLIRFVRINSIIVIIVEKLFKHHHHYNYKKLLIITIGQLLNNFYLLDKFFILSKRWNLLPPPSSSSLISIEMIFIDECKPQLWMILKTDETILNEIFQSFVVVDKQQQKQSKLTLPFIAYCIEEYPSSLSSNQNNDNDNFIDQTLHRIIEPIVIVEMMMTTNDDDDNHHSDDQTNIVQRLSNFADLSDETIYELLFTLNIALHKLPKMNDSIKSYVQHVMKLLSQSNFSHYQQQRTFPTINNWMQYKITFLTANLLQLFIEQFINDSSFGIDEFNMCISLYKHWCQLIFAIPDDQIQLDTAILCSKIFQSLSIFICSCQKWIKDHHDEEEEIHLNIIESIRNFLAYHCLNMLLPLFIIISDLFDQNKPMFIELIHNLSKVLLCIDQECLQDMAMLELNQSLLMYNENSLVEKRMKCLIDQLSTTTTKSKQMNCLRTDNGYYDFIIEHITPLLMKNDLNTIFTAYHLVSLACHSANWSSTKITENRFNESMDTEITDITLSQLTSIKNDDGHNQDNDDDNVDNMYYPPKIIMALLESLFSTITIDDLQSQATFAYLLVWTIYLRLLQQFPLKNYGENEIRSDLINYLVESNLHNQFLQNLFLLMHDSCDWNDLDRNHLQSIININTNNNQLDCLEDSNRLLQLINEKKSDTERNSRLAVFVYYQSLCHMANLVRCWFNTLRHHQKESVDYVTRRYFSQLLMEKELEQIKNVDQEKLGNIQIRFSRKLHEISAIYSLKEISFGIKFTFEANYPLTALSIQCFDKSGVSEDVCRKWLQRLTIFFNRMNCSILDGIIMIKPTMDKLFAGMEECMICLYVLYGMNAQLPRFKCPQCKKKFHTTCMRKWFQTHHSATCPQCKFEFQ